MSSVTFAQETILCSVIMSPLPQLVGSRGLLTQTGPFPRFFYPVFTELNQSLCSSRSSRDKAWSCWQHGLALLEGCVERGRNEADVEGRIEPRGKEDSLQCSRAWLRVATGSCYSQGQVHTASEHDKVAQHPCVWVSQGSCHKVPHIGCLKTAEMHSFTSLNAGSPRSRFQQGWFLLRALR